MGTNTKYKSEMPLPPGTKLKGTQNIWNTKKTNNWIGLSEKGSFQIFS